MLDSVRKFFNERLEGDQGGVNKLALATAALMFEVMRADAEITAVERQQAVTLLMETFELTSEDLAAIAGLAEEEVEDANDLYQFTRLVNDHYDEDEKYALIVNMWRIAYADGHADHYEEHVIRKVADLVHLRHRHFIRAKLEARGQDD